MTTLEKNQQNLGVQLLSEMTHVKPDGLALFFQEPFLMGNQFNPIMETISFIEKEDNL